jgi:hypothetical protein
MTLALSPSDLALAQELLRSDRLTIADRVELEGTLDSLRLDLEREHYRLHPIDWLVDKLRIRRETLQWSLLPEYAGYEWDGTPDPFARIADELAAWHNVGVESGTATGKTFFGAGITYWFLDNWDDSLVVTSAPKAEQLTLHIWKEIGRLWGRYVAYRRREPRNARNLETGRMEPLQDPELIKLRLRMRPGQPGEEEVWTAVGFGVGVGAEEKEGSASRAQGFHAPDMLIITEETPGMEPAVLTAFEQTSRAPHNLRLAFGNPDHQQDELHRFCLRKNVVPIRISAEDHPNVVTGNPSIVPGATSAKAIDEVAEEYGIEHRLYQSRVRGISPSEATDSLIRLSWCYAARELWKDPIVRAEMKLEGPRAMGVDVANSDAPDADKAAVAEGEGAWLESVRAFHCDDANRLADDWIIPNLRPGVGWLKAPKLTPERVAVDADGVGAGTVNEARRVGFRVVALKSGSSPIYIKGWVEQFQNLRAQMYWQMMLDLKNQRIGLPDDPELFGDLTAVKWGTKGGVIFMEEKKKIIERLRRSPDKGDAAVYWNWIRQHAGFVPPKKGSYVTAGLKG